MRAAMPGFIGKKLCPQLVIVKPNFSKYQEVCEEVRSILKEYDPNFCPMGVDESYLDITEYVNEVVTGNKDFGTGMSPSESRMRTSPSEIDPVPCTEHTGSLNGSSTQDPVDKGSNNHTHTLSQISSFGSKNNGQISFPGSSYYECVQKVVSEIRHRIEARTSLTASAGIAPNKMLAKISSNFNKPNGQYFLEPSKDNVMDFVRKLPIRKVTIETVAIVTHMYACSW